MSALWQIFPALTWIQAQWEHQPYELMSGFDTLLGAVGGVNVSTDKTSYKVGEVPTYRISGGKPGSAIAWTSLKNGVATGEYQSTYGDFLDGQGNAVIRAGGPWTQADIGDWQKIALLIPPDYTGDPNQLQYGEAFFSVSLSGAKQQASGTSAQASGSGFFDSKVDIPGIGPVKTVYLVGGAVGIGGLYLLTSGSRK